MAELLSNLKNVAISFCNVIEEVVSNRDDEDEESVASTNTSTILFPHLDKLNLEDLPNLKRIGGGSGAKGGSKEISSTTPIHGQYKLPQVNDADWSLCQYARKIDIRSCRVLPYVIPSYAIGQMQKLENLIIDDCESLVEVFETQRININGSGTTNIDEGSGGNDATMVTQRVKQINVPQLSNLKDLFICDCDLLQHLFTFSTLESLTQLQKLSLIYCKEMKVIVKEDHEEQTTISSKVVLFPGLKSIVLKELPNLVGFFLGVNEFQWPLLDYVRIDDCPQMRVFRSDRSLTPKLNYIHTKLGKHSLECGLNVPTSHERSLSGSDSTNSCAITPWSFHNLIEVDVKYHYEKKIIPSNELVQLQKLEKIHVQGNSYIEEVFEALEGTDSSELPKLREVELKELSYLKYIWKNNPSMVLKFPNLTILSIQECNRLQHVFTCSMVGSLSQLQDLHISNCRQIEVIVKETNVVAEGGECDDKVKKIITLARLKSLQLEDLPHLKGFCLKEEDFSLPSLDALEIIGCGEITVFTKGDLETRELREIDTSFGRCELKEEDLNSFINTKLTEGFQF